MAAACIIGSICRLKTLSPCLQFVRKNADFPAKLLNLYYHTPQFEVELDKWNTNGREKSNL